ncbi:tripartite motif-containing protein 59-like [Ruditapes philippinarum]|uniref:tripartite motif-containing protein 59-like n=1 Tax=Ruditapes philippinarum TaxID=129788 RepID=UPI00295C0499|nr:tripartite motif-containing protein 59-like [Ruditapes philippinarum]
MAESRLVLTSVRLDELNCAVCLQTLTDPRVIGSCQHMFCLKCILDYVSASLSNNESDIKCPYCRKKIDKDKQYFSDRVNDRESWQVCFPKNIIVHEVIDKLKSEDEYCKLHLNKINEHVCVNHSMLICGDCLRTEQKECRNVQSVEEYTPKYSDLVQFDIELLNSETEKQIGKISSLLRRNEQCKQATGIEKHDLTISLQTAKLKLAKLQQNHANDIEKFKKDIQNASNIYAILHCSLEITKRRQEQQKDIDVVIDDLEKSYSRHQAAVEQKENRLRKQKSSVKNHENNVSLRKSSDMRQQFDTSATHVQEIHMSAESGRHTSYRMRFDNRPKTAKIQTTRLLDNGGNNSSRREKIDISYIPRRSSVSTANLTEVKTVFEYRSDEARRSRFTTDKRCSKRSGIVENSINTRQLPLPSVEAVSRRALSNANVLPPIRSKTFL